ncbi:MAG TPA: VOC family protein [Kribbella sp.]|nr:VOC family protein [Kribbella sp.]
MSIRFDHLGLISDTAEQNSELARFFADVLGLEVTGDAAEGYAEVKAGAVTIALHRGNLIDHVSPHGGTLLQFSSDDVRADVEAIRSRGGVISLEPMDTDWGTTTAYVSGPNGVLVELYQWREPQH